MKKLSILIIGIVTVIFIFLTSHPLQTNKTHCLVDEECIPEQCCHPYSCININYKLNCTGIMCTQVCEGPIDCGAGSCKCINNKCQVVPTK